MSTRRFLATAATALIGAVVYLAAATALVAASLETRWAWSSVTAPWWVDTVVTLTSSLLYLPYPVAVAVVFESTRRRVADRVRWWVACTAALAVTAAATVVFYLTWVRAWFDTVAFDGLAPFAAPHALPVLVVAYAAAARRR